MANDLNLLIFGLLPAALGSFVVALLAALAGAGDRGAAVWLGAMVIGLCAGVDVIPLSGDRKWLRWTAELVLAVCCIAAER